METTVGGDTHNGYGLGMSDSRTMGKRSLEWDLNDWKWDGDLLFATQLSSAPDDCGSRQFFPIGSGIPEMGNSCNSSSSGSEEVNPEKEKRRLKNQIGVNAADHVNLNDDASALSLKLGRDGIPSTDKSLGIWEGTSGKKAKLTSLSSNRVVCQVEGCGADLEKVKDYHRRHKVCEMHSKANMALVASIMQRFCQQCSRFHALQEFDEGKRSCRRRLAGHNRRRRKTHPEAIVRSSLNDEQTSGYLMISLLKILSNMQSNKSEQMKDQDLLSHLLKSLVSQGGQNVSRLLQECNNLSSNKTPSGNLLENNPQGLTTANCPNVSAPESEIPQRSVHVNDATERLKLNDFDLNDTYVDLDECENESERLPVTYPLWVQQDSNQSSPPQTSGQSDSASAQSPSSSGSVAQSRTDRIVFKLFGKEPKDIPILLRAQILDWLSHSPTDIESYMRPGCIILTIYLRLAEATWEQLCCNLTSCLRRLFKVSDISFWSTGWMYIRIQHQIAFGCNGKVVLDMPLPAINSKYAKISSLKPVAVSTSEKAHFLLKGYNLSKSGTRFLCALDGKYLGNGSSESIKDDDIAKADEALIRSFYCPIPLVFGRGFVEIEDDALCSSFFPFIVASEDVCSEIRVLESAIDIDETNENITEATGKIKAKNEAINFLHELGWLLHRSHVKSRLSDCDPISDAFPFNRLKWLIEFSIEHDWRAVVNHLLDIFFEGIVDSGDHGSLKHALFDMNLLHRAVRRNSRPLVELLVRYVPTKVSDRLVLELKSERNSMLFTPDAKGPAGLTPLHIAAGRDGSEDVLDALTDDPQMVGMAAWKKAVCSSSGCTPEDYARLRGHYSYIHLVQRKIHLRRKTDEHHPVVVLDIPATTTKHTIIQISNSNKMCGDGRRRAMVYRPVMLSMVAIAALCVCVALLFKSSPMLFTNHTIRWELLRYEPR